MIAKVRYQLLRRPNTVMGCIFSPAGFTAAASLLARFTTPQVVLLWEDDEIDFALQNQWFCVGLTEKYRQCVAKGIPDIIF